MILLDTNALIWVRQGHQRTRALRAAPRLYVSPASILELALLVEIGRLRLGPKDSLATVAADDRWTVDDPPALRWFSTAADLIWTRDPFDRLIAAHALLRGWRLATADETLADRLGAARVVVL